MTLFLVEAWQKPLYKSILQIQNYIMNSTHKVYQSLTYIFQTPNQYMAFINVTNI